MLVILAVYPDCRQEFRDADDAAFRMGNWDAERVGYFTPYLKGMKYRYFSRW
jgi:7-cyano-7-deazaguanine synthase